jgi:hypothetical protein
VSEIQLVARLAGDDGGAQMGISSLLNTKEEIEEQMTCERRRQEFESACVELAQPPGIQRLRLPEPLAMLTWN